MHVVAGCFARHKRNPLTFGNRFPRRQPDEMAVFHTVQTTAFYNTVGISFVGSGNYYNAYQHDKPKYR